MVRCLKSIFGIEPSANPKLIGSGFAFKNGKWLFNSYTFNTGTSFHDNSNAERETLIIGKALNTWVSRKRSHQNFSVRERNREFPSEFMH